MTITGAGISAGCGEQALDALNEQARHKQGKHKHPTYALVDSQSVKTQYAQSRSRH